MTRFKIWLGMWIVRLGWAIYRRQWCRTVFRALGRAVIAPLVWMAELEAATALRRGDRAEAKYWIRNKRLVQGIACHSSHDKVFKAIGEYANLPEGWNTYDAGPPSARAIENAQFFVLLCKKWDVEINWYAPTADESILVRATTADNCQEWEFDSDGDTAMSFKKWGEPWRYLDVEKRDFERTLLRHT